MKLTDTFPIETSSTLDGYTLQNASGEACGGTLLERVRGLVQLGVRATGGEARGARLVAMAERFGFNQPVPIPGATESTIPSAATIGESARGRLFGDRPGQGSGKRARDDRRRRDDRDGRPAADPDPAGASAASFRPRHQPPRRGGGAADDGRGRAVRDRGRRGDPGRDRRRQDRHRRARRHRLPQQPERRLAQEHRLVVRRLRALWAIRRSSSGPCSPRRAPALRPRRRPFGRCSRRRSRRTSEWGAGEQMLATDAFSSRKAGQKGVSSVACGAIAAIPPPSLPSPGRAPAKGAGAQRPQALSRQPSCPRRPRRATAQEPNHRRAERAPNQS